MKKLFFKVSLSVVLICAFSFAVLAGPSLISTPSNPYPWAKVECWASDAANMQSGQEPIVKLSLPANTKIRSWFPSNIFVRDGSSSSYDDYSFGDYGHLRSNKYFLLGYAPNWSSATKPYPILLVHGAADDMNRAWTHPMEIQTPGSISETGLMQYLSGQGFAVFAISFPHTQGNNLIQGQLIADALEVIKSATGKSQVDIVAHSKGNLSAISYMSSLNNQWSDTQWMTDYRGDVRKYIAIGAPFKGIDTSFRYYLSNLTTIEEDLNCPVAFYNAYIYYSYRDYKRWDMTDTYDKNYFQGQTQLLHNWVEDPNTPIGFNAESATAGDFNSTRNALYFGGHSFYISSEGIDNAIDDRSGSMGTSNFIEKMNNRGIDPYIDVFVLYGYNQTIDHTWFGYPIGEKAASSDGILFQASATYTSGITRRGANLIWKTGKNLNHIQITCNTSAMSWVRDALNY